MLAETSSTTIADECAGSETIVCVCGCRDTTTKATIGPASAAASASRIASVRRAAGAKRSGVSERDRRHRVTFSSTSVTSSARRRGVGAAPTRRGRSASSAGGCARSEQTREQLERAAAVGRPARASASRASASARSSPVSGSGVAAPRRSRPPSRRRAASPPRRAAPPEPRERREPIAATRGTSRRRRRVAPKRRPRLRSIRRRHPSLHLENRPRAVARVRLRPSRSRA